MAKTALECGLAISEWTGRDSLCQADSSHRRRARLRWRQAARSRSGSTPQRRADLGELVAERPAVGALLALVVRARRPSAPCSRCCRRSRGSPRPRRRSSRCSAGSAASSARLSSIGRASGAGLLDQRRDDALDRRVGEVPLAGELQRRQPVRARRSGASARASRSPASIQPCGPEGAVVALGELHARAGRRPRRGRRSRRPG